MIRLEIRVVRGPDWSHGDQDGGEGHVGTVVEIPGENNSTLPENCVAVLWDGGEKHQYRAGAEGTHDLLVFNNASKGASHKVMCDGCEENNFEGLRWKCNRCGEYNLCNSCYMSDKHDTTHEFTRFDTRNSEGETVQSRSKSQDQRVQSIGMFVGATVSRGPDWEFEDQFGDADVQGEVIEAKNGRLGVKWPTKSVIFNNIFEDGRHILKCVNPVGGFHYYKSHLPLLGQVEFDRRDGLGQLMDLTALLMSPLMELLERASASESTNTNCKGYRVIRGPSWEWEDQDGGEGHVGTIVESVTNEKDVIVIWDSGNCRNYRVGNGGAYDLRVLDNAPAGVKHKCIECTECHEAPLFGIRWKCSVCEDYDLCSTCYMSDKHDLTHPFLRIDKEYSSRPFPVPARIDSQKMPVMGIFPGASVKPGKSWKWEEIKGEIDGEVVRIGKWTPETRRSRADVRWPLSTGRLAEYRLGHKGKVDLQCVKAAPGGHCYKEHLPVLGKKEVVEPKFKAGDKVNIIMPKGLVARMQEDYGGWSENMEGYMRKVGSVIKINDYGVVTVKYDDGAKGIYNQDVLNQVWINPDSLQGIPEKVPATTTGEASEEQKTPLSTESDKDDFKTVTQPLCKICLTRDACVAFVPCGHLVSCPECAEGLDKCPICRSEIRQWLRTFIQ